MEKNKLIALLKGIASSLIWGLGQLFNRQYIKAAIFFMFFVSIILIEVSSGSYDETFDIFEDKIAGDEIQEELSNYLPVWYYYNLKGVNPTSDYAYEDFDLLHDVAESNGYTFDEVNLVFYDENNQVIEVDNIPYASKDMYEYLGEQLVAIEEEALVNGVEDLEAEAEVLADAAVLSIVEDTIYEHADRNVRLGSNFVADRDTIIESLAIEDLEDLGHTVGEANWDNTLSTYLDDNNEPLLLEAVDNMVVEEYALIYDEEFEAVERQTIAIYYIGYYNGFFNDLYGDLVLEYESVASFTDMLQARLISVGLNMDNDDYNKMLIRIYFEYNPELYEEFIDETDNFFYERAGFFVKGIWGIVTLGSIPQQTILEQS